MHDELLSPPKGTTLIENEQQHRYPGLRVRRDGDAVVVHIPARFRRRNGRCMILTDGEPVAVSSTQRDTLGGGGNRTLIEAILRGDEPDGISLRKLQKNLPVRWDEQRKMYGRA